MSYRSVVIAAIQSAGLMITGFLIPLLGQMIAVFAPVPLMTLTVRSGRAAGLAALAIAATLIMLITGGQAVFLSFFLGLGLMAIGISEGMLRRLRPETAILLGALLPLAALTLVGVPLLLKTGKNPVALAEIYLRQSVSDARQIYTQAGLQQVADMVGEASERVIFYLVRLLPGIVLAVTLFQSACCYGMARSLLIRKGPAHDAAAGPSLAAWHAPDVWIWGLIAGLGCIAFPGRTIHFIGLNVAIVYLLVYAAQGVSIVESILRRARVPALWRSVLHALILALPLAVGVVALGVVDIWADFRKIRKPAHPA